VYVINTDLLPPLFDQILDYFEVKRSGTLFREYIVKGVETEIIDAAATYCRAQDENALRPQSEPRSQESVSENDKAVSLETSDRLSGSDLSRAALVQKLLANDKLTHNNPSLSTTIIEIALLLIEAQIDLRLQVEKSFKVAGIEFSHRSDDKSKYGDAAEWCRLILVPAMQSAAEDKPTGWSFGKRKSFGIRVLVDTIQLSATLRTAVPYKITVDRDLLESLLTTTRSHQGIRLLHISDLHLTAELDETGRKLRKPMLTPTHSEEAVRHVSAAVATLQPRYDALVATGDLTTGGARESFETVLQYIQSGSITGANFQRIAYYGLKASRFKRILLPGNHDRYAGQTIPGQRLDYTCEEVLQLPRKYPYMLGFRPHDSADNSFALLFLVFDSNLQAGRDRSRFRDNVWKDALAKGEIRDAELITARDLVKATMEKKEVARIGGGTLKFDPPKTIRIALLHHHPVTKFILPETITEKQDIWRRIKAWIYDPVKNYSARIEAESMTMENSEAFLKCCSDCGIQLILFGHQHYPYQRLVTRSPSLGMATESESIGLPSKHMRAFCCPTTLQYDAPANGFYVFDFLSESRFEWMMYASHRDGDSGKLIGEMKQIRQRSFDLSKEPSEDEQGQQYEFGVV
jgi:hypothetical protein